MKMHVLATAVVVGVGFSLTANCSDLRREPSTAGPEVVRVGYIPIAECLQLYVISSQDYFGTDSIRFEMVPFAGGALILQALATQDIDLAFTGTVPLLQAAAKGVSLVAVGGGTLQDPQHAVQSLVVPVRAAISSSAELRGKSIATNTFRSIDHAYSIAYLQQNGVAANDVRFVEIPFPQMLQVLATGQVDAASLIEPFVTIGVQNGQIRVLDHHVVAVDPNLEMTTYVARPEWVRTNPELASQIATLLDSATTFIQNNEPAVRLILAERLNLQPSVADSMMLPRPIAGLTSAGLERTSNLLQRIGFIDQPVDVAKILRNSRE